MKKSSYIDISALCQVIGCIYTNPRILEQEDKYRFNKEDFCDSFHQVIFSSIYNIYQLGAKEITISAIEDYLATRPKQQGEYKAHNGGEYILKCAENANINTFSYYYSRMKKLSLLRAYESMGMDLRWLYDVDSFDAKTKEKQEEWLDNASLEDIANKIDDKIDAIRIEFAEGAEDRGVQLGEHTDEILEELSQAPALGLPFYTEYMNTITRGARPGKFYLCSAPTGAGKSRSMIGDACYTGCSQMYDLVNNKWISIGMSQPTLYIGTEQDELEVTTMALAFISGVDEEHILLNSYYVGEEERVRKASQILKNGKLYFICIPDFGIEDIKTTIKKYIREKGIVQCYFDYIHSSPKILMEVGGKSGIKGMREDSVLFLLSSALKDIATEYGIFIKSSTQLNMNWTETEEPDQNCLRGSKAIADRIDVGMILLEATNDDKEKLRPMCMKNNIPIPNMKISVYKNRQGQHRGEYLWLNANRGCCRFNGLFMTKWDYTLIEASDIKIKVQDESIF